jgi:hypothetical protein
MGKRLRMSISKMNRAVAPQNPRVLARLEAGGNSVMISRVARQSGEG